MARGQFLCALVLFSACILTEAHLSGFTTKTGKKPCSVKVVVHNVADRSMSFTCSEFGKGVKPFLAEKGKWTAIGPINVAVEKNSILHLTVTVGTGKRYGVVRKSLVINLLKLFQYNLEGSKFVVLTAIENAREQTLKIKIGRRVALTFNLY